MSDDKNVDLPSVFPHVVRIGRGSATIYRRVWNTGAIGWEVANYSTGRRKLESFPTVKAALDRARQIARAATSREPVSTTISATEAADASAASSMLARHGVTLRAGAQTLCDCLKLVGDPTTLLIAAKEHAARMKPVTAKRVSEVVDELLKVRSSRGASARYVATLRSVLGNFSLSFVVDIHTITTSELQEWMDRRKQSARTYLNVRQVLNVLFRHAQSRGYCLENPVLRIDRVKASGSEAEVWTPAELRRLLDAAVPGILPMIVLGAFAGLRSAEIERITWEDVRWNERCIIVGASAAKTATRRVVPFAPNIDAWLAKFKGRKGPVWPGSSKAKGDQRAMTIAGTAGTGDPITWRPNALRHSYASYRFGMTGDAGRVAGELGNTATVVHRHYRELVTEAASAEWFSIVPRTDPPSTDPNLPAGSGCAVRSEDAEAPGPAAG